jgi:N-acetyl sugar amidotransferase
MIIKKRNLIKIYNLPKKVIFCKKCVISNQRPRITFNKKGICSACQYAEFKRNKINWKKREEQLLRLLDKHRSKTNKNDIIVPCSGGKDGSWVAHQLKFKYGMNPLCVTWSPIVPTSLGKKNLTNFINTGFDHVMEKPKTQTYKKLTSLSFSEVGDPFQPFIYGQYNYPVKVALENNISVMMYGENGEVEYGGDMKYAFKPYNDFEARDKHYFSKFPVDVWKKYNLSEKELLEFSSPKKSEVLKNKIRMYFFGYYKFWDPQENFYYCKKNTGFQVNDDRTEGTYSKYASLDDKLDGFHYYLMFIKFGIGRATSDAAHEVRDGKITREEAVYLVNKYDGEFPKKYFDIFLKFCDSDKKKFNLTVDSWRSPHIWKKHKNKWKLKYSVS